MPAAAVVTLDWNTFLGSSDGDYSEDIAVDDHGNVYVTGRSGNTWGNPVNPFNGNADAFVAKFDSSGNLTWNTFLGSSTEDQSRDITVDDHDNVYVIGNIGKTWGNPVNPFNGNADAFVAKFDSSGNLSWNTFLGSLEGNQGGDYGEGIAVDDHGNATWGNPVNAYAGSSDGFIAKLTTNPTPSDLGCKHAIYSLDDQTLAIPAVEVPILSIIDQQPTGETILLTSILKQYPTDSTQFSILFLSEVFSEEIAAASTCPATYSLTSGVLSLPWVDMPVVAQLGSQQSEVGLEVFKVVMQWDAGLERFAVEEIQRVE